MCTPSSARCASELELGYGPLATAGCTAGCSIPISPPSPPSGACSAACATEYANCLLYGPGPTACAHELAIGTGPLASVCTAGCTIPPSPSPPASPSQSYTIIYDNYLCGAEPNECYIGRTGHSTCDYATCTAMCDAAGPVNCVALAMNYPFDNICRLCTQSELNARTSNSQWQIWQNSIPPSPSPPASPSQSYTIIYDNYLCGAEPNECYIGRTGHSTCDYATCTAMCDAAGPVNCVALAMNYPFDNICRLCTQSELNARTSNSQWQIWQNSVP